MDLHNTPATSWDWDGYIWHCTGQEGGEGGRMNQTSLQTAGTGISIYGRGRVPEETPGFEPISQ